MIGDFQTEVTGKNEDGEVRVGESCRPGQELGLRLGLRLGLGLGFSEGRIFERAVKEHLDC